MADGITVLQARPLQWRYSISNTGNAGLENVVINDNNGTPGIPGDDFMVTSCVVGLDGMNSDPTQHSSAVAPFTINRGGRLDCIANGIAGNDD